MEHLRIELSDILLATDNFSKTHKIEHIEYCILYKAELRCFDRDYLSFVKIKRFHPRSHDFSREIQSLSHCNHQNIESLLGFCEKGSYKILVYEYVSTKYLSSYLNSHILTWEKYLKICIDVAHGLSYLHNEIEDQMMVIHGDIRCEKILLDDYWRAKIIGFEKSVLLLHNHDDDTLHLHKPNCAVTDIHMDPEEYSETLKRKGELDVFSFGLVMYQIIFGAKSSDLPTMEYFDSDVELTEGLEIMLKVIMKKNSIAPTIREENIENNFFLHKGPNKDSLDTFFDIMCWCILGKQKQRPTIELAIKELEKALAFQVSQ